VNRLRPRTRFTGMKTVPLHTHTQKCAWRFFPQNPPADRLGGVLVSAERAMSSARNTIETVFRFDEADIWPGTLNATSTQETNGRRCCNDAASKERDAEL
jgi:hypothetical protein